MNKKTDIPKRIYKYEGNTDAFIWKHPDGCFNFGDQVIVKENYRAILFRKGNAGEADTKVLLQPGIHTISYEKFYDLSICNATSEQFEIDLYYLRILLEDAYKYSYGRHDLHICEKTSSCNRSEEDGWAEADYSFLIKSLEQSQASLDLCKMLTVSFELFVCDSLYVFDTIYIDDSYRMDKDRQYNKAMQDWKIWELFFRPIEDFLHKYLEDCFGKGVFDVFNEDGSIKNDVYNSLKRAMENYLYKNGLGMKCFVIDTKIDPKSLKLMDEAILQSKVKTEDKDVKRNKLKENSEISNMQSVLKVQKPYKGNKPYIFFSYSHRNKSEVIKIIARLQQDGFRVWYDEGIDPGTEWDEKIAFQVENCELFIACISKEYIESSNCKDELNFARDLEKNRLLVYLVQTELPAGMKMRLSRIQAIHKYTYNYEDDFYQKLMECPDIHTCLEK